MTKRGAAIRPQRFCGVCGADTVSPHPVSARGGHLIGCPLVAKQIYIESEPRSIRLDLSVEAPTASTPVPPAGRLPAAQVARAPRAASSGRRPRSWQLVRSAAEIMSDLDKLERRTAPTGR